MRATRSLSVILLVVTLGACAGITPRSSIQGPRIVSTQVPPTQAFTATLNLNGSTSTTDTRTIETNAAGEAIDVRGKAVFTVVAPTGRRPTLQIFVSRDKHAVTGWEVRPVAETSEISNGYRIKISDIQGAAIPHDRIVKISVKSASGTDSATYHLRNLDTFRLWGGLGSPVLYRVEGNAADFSLDDFAPSIAGGPRFIFGSGNHQFIGLNPLITIFRAADADTDGDRPFSLSLGGIVDIGGWVQVGGNYQFKDKKTYLIVGVRPEVWSR